MSDYLLPVYDEGLLRELLINLFSNSCPTLQIDAFAESGAGEYTVTPTGRAAALADFCRATGVTQDKAWATLASRGGVELYRQPYALDTYVGLEGDPYLRLETLAGYFVAELHLASYVTGDRRLYRVTDHNGEAFTCRTQEIGAIARQWLRRNRDDAARANRTVH